MCFVIAAAKVQRGRHVFIVNDSSYLTFRDYKKGFQAGTNLGVTVNYLTSPILNCEFDPAIWYTSLENLRESFIKLPELYQKPITIIIDEFDSIAFENALNDAECL